MRILAVSPHTDDAELGAGATMARFIEQEHTVDMVVFSAPDTQLVRECKASVKKLGLKGLTIYDFERRRLQENRQDILERLLQLRYKLKPELILGPSPHDLHQDHGTVAAEVLRAFKATSILSYCLPWNHVRFDAVAFCVVDQRHLDAKLAALGCYKSQQDREYFHPGLQTAWARTRGAQIGVPLAEVFEIRRWRL